MPWSDRKPFQCQPCYAKTDLDPSLNLQWQINRLNRFVVQRRPFRPLPTTRQRSTIKICCIIVRYFTHSRGWRPLHSTKVSSHRRRMVLRLMAPVTVPQSPTKICCAFAVWCLSLSYRADQMRRRRQRLQPIWISPSTNITCIIIICSCGRAFHR